MLIIIEGPEAAGKTTLAKQLHLQTGFPYQHRSKPNTEAEKQEMMCMYLAALDAGADMILDRCWYSEIVYGNIMRDKTYISIEQMYELEEKLARKGGIIIHCTDDVGVLWDRCQVRGEDYVTNYNTLVKIKFAFEHLFHGMHHLVPIVRYSVNEKNV